MFGVVPNLSQHFNDGIHKFYNYYRVVHREWIQIFQKSKHTSSEIIGRSPETTWKAVKVVAKKDEVFLNKGQKCLEALVYSGF